MVKVTNLASNNTAINISGIAAEAINDNFMERLNEILSPTMHVERDSTNVFAGSPINYWKIQTLIRL